MVRIFVTLGAVSTVLLVVAFALGLSIGDGNSGDVTVQSGNTHYHVLTALFGLIVAFLVHAIVLTYFVGTGRWVEETSNAYKLPEGWKQQGRTLKYRTLPSMVVALLLLILAGVFGAAADVGFTGWLGLSAATIHLLVVVVALIVNLLVNIQEFHAIHHNGQLIDGVMQEVRRIRQARGLPV